MCLWDVLHARFPSFVGNVLGPWAEKPSWVLLWLQKEWLTADPFSRKGGRDVLSSCWRFFMLIPA